MAPAEEPPLTDVALSIYDLRGTWALNHATRLAGIGGAYHVGVEVYRLEWSYGWTPQGTGVYVGQVGQSWQGPLGERVPLGRTALSADEVMAILKEMRSKWMGPGYHPLRHNCGHFSVEFAKRLQVQDAPAWLNTLAGVGDRVMQSLGVVVRPLSVASHPSLANAPGCSALEFSCDLLEAPCDQLSAEKQKDDPRVERQWQWASEKMKVYARGGS
mmetsp:Transcript_142977/g.347323  ORF Transcript_142977/g.347323 Transcript_142977/m.347323 type:complete len:215 (-) Transcript_142977:60-704(-)